MGRHGTAFALLGLVAGSSTQKFLQSTRTTTAAPSQKTLSTPAEVIDQLNFVVTDSVHCGKTEVYAVAPELYGMIRGPIGEGEEFLYPSDKAVTWLSDHGFFERMLNQEDLCCNSDASDFADAMTQCMCKTAVAVEISKIDGQYEFAAVDATKAGAVPVQPMWTSQEFHDALVQSYAWVFNDVTLVLPLQDLQRSCRPSLATWTALESFNHQAEPGLEAYAAIMADATYGVSAGGQMHQLGCEATLDKETGEGGCGCKGLKDGLPYCHTATDVVLFCGSGGIGSCDPRPFLCPEGVLPVGYVRAYLHKFFDAIPYFHGTGFADEDGKVPEFVVSPNIRADAKGVKRTAPEQLFGSCAV